MTIRPATAGDAADLARLCGELGYPTSAAETADRLRIVEESTRGEILVAVVDGRVAGWMGVREDAALESGTYAELTGLVVDAEHRGRGIGEALVARAAAWARERGHRRLRVRSNVVRERAHRFYERLGFVVAKRQAVFDKAL